MKQGMLFFLLLIGIISKAQHYNPNLYPQGKVSITGGYYWGTILKHTAKFIPDVTQKSHAFELSVSKITKGEKEWQRKLNYPEIGGALLMARFGDNEIFGNAYGVFPFAKIWLIRSKWVDWYYRMGIGLAYLNKPFNYVTNPDNNVIGSKINNCTHMSMGIDIKANENLSFFTALNFTHFSNASFQSPNLGINYAAFSGGFRYNVNPTKGDYNQEPVSKPVQKNFFKGSFGMAFYEYRTPGGPKYPIYIFTGAYARATSINNRIFGGLIYGYDIGRKEFLTQYVPNYKKIKAHDLGFLWAMNCFWAE
ncbi:MAG: acyloxyacyl hydrolase [Chitinophagales bacterium]|nr:acyloxyacyl hydrolase [Chitinophagales bacterium]